MVSESPDFGIRLKTLIGDSSVSAFARKVGLSESLIRKYIKGSEPSLSRAYQIAKKTNVSLEWLALGTNSAENSNSPVDRVAIALALNVVNSISEDNKARITELERTTQVLSVYKFLVTNKRPDGELDELSGRLFHADAIGANSQVHVERRK